MLRANARSTRPPPRASFPPSSRDLASLRLSPRPTTISQRHRLRCAGIKDRATRASTPRRGWRTSRPGGRLELEPTRRLGQGTFAKTTTVRACHWGFVAIAVILTMRPVLVSPRLLCAGRRLPLLARHYLATTTRRTYREPTYRLASLWSPESAVPCGLPASAIRRSLRALPHRPADRMDAWPSSSSTASTRQNPFLAGPRQ